MIAKNGDELIATSVEIADVICIQVPAFNDFGPEEPDPFLGHKFRQVLCHEPSPHAANNNGTLLGELIAVTAASIDDLDDRSTAVSPFARATNDSRLVPDFEVSHVHLLCFERLAQNYTKAVLVIQKRFI